MTKLHTHSFCGLLAHKLAAVPGKVLPHKVLFGLMSDSTITQHGESVRKLLESIMKAEPQPAHCAQDVPAAIE